MEFSLDSIHDYIVETLTEVSPNELWHRICLRGELEGTRELGIVPVGQKWSLQSIVTNGVANNSPAFAVRINDYLLVAVDKEGVGQEIFEGNMAALPGERVSLAVAEKGRFEVTLTFIRELLSPTPRAVHMGRANEMINEQTKHDPDRDMIERVGEYRDPDPPIDPVGV